MPALSSGVCSTSFWGDTMNKLPYFLVALCLCMFCSFSAYADDAADPAQADSAASSDEVVVPPEEGKVVQVQGVQTYDPQLYERMDKNCKNPLMRLQKRSYLPQKGQNQAQKMQEGKIIPHSFQRFPGSL